MSSARDSTSWEDTAEVCRKILRDSIPKQWAMNAEDLQTKDIVNANDFLDNSGILSTEELEMTRSTVKGLLAKYASGTWTVEAVATAFLKRATVANQLLNFATEFLTESALEGAKALDKHFQENKTLVGPLHGVPISIKARQARSMFEHIAVGGKICNASFVSKIGNIPADDAHIVQLLKRAGAIVPFRTNQPQSLMHLDCNNNITGMTKNPLNPTLSPGGSSGGEGAAVGSRCSVLGVGTDIGGYVQNPASYCDAYGFKPTALRNPALGLNGAMGGQESIRGCVGPLSKSMDDLVRFEKALLDQKPWDLETTLVPLAWRDVKVTKDSLTVGIIVDDGALAIAEEKLKAAGIKVKHFAPYDHARGWDIVSRLYFADGGERVHAALDASGEPMLPLTQQALNWPLTITQNWELNFEREKYRREYHALMKERGVDVILCPAYVGVGALQGQTRHWHYTAIWNILDQPAVSFPSGVVTDKAKDPRITDFKPRSEEDAAEMAAYDPELYHGIPISIQLAGKHHQDEELLDAAKLVEEALLA
ncbi:unnamed protein product [Clonostachys rosea]|uniref:Amidase domain-containing protein n=1 Tax=Bionectria ochroleuca TaxID=29856 RepID=A0ABY6UER6_BIOOC|nr:unnamed protein product [Clonostachys rosea]